MRTLPALLFFVGCSPSEEPEAGASALACDAPGFSEPVVPAERWERTTFEGWPVMRWLPAEPRGLVFYFHGTGGHYDDVTYVEVTREIDTLVRAGFAFVATESTLRGAEAQWEKEGPDWTANPDLARLDGIYQDLIASGAITADTPVFTDGFSDGGGMSGFFSSVAKERGWPVAAAAMHSSGGMSSADIPQIWMIAKNDREGLAEDAAEIHAEMVEDGAIVENYLAEEVPLDPARLLRIPRFDQAAADEAFADLVDLGIIDSNGVRLVDLETQLESSLNLFESESRVQQDWEVSTQLRVVWSTHRFDSQWSQHVCEFFTAALP